ncbi:MAG: TlpA family protein disulfide reductase [Polaribacter sp.]
MVKKVLHFSSFFILMVFMGCKDHPKDTITFFGGKIINPKSKYVILYSMDKIIDTLFLDKRNTFFTSFKDMNEGLYYFRHGNENQYIYLEPKDSLMLRLNTWDFDESLVFVGKGAERNNFLIDCFLEGENDRKIFYQLDRLSPKKYEAEVNSIINEKLGTYNKYAKSHLNETAGYRKILHVALTYPIYSRIERYPINHILGTKITDLPKVDASFYNFRKNLELNNDSLMYYTPYVRYIRDYLYNVTYSLGHKPMVNEYSSGFTVDLLKVINKNINSEDSKNAFLKQTLIQHFYNKSSSNINQEAFDTFLKLSTNRKDKNLIRKFLKNTKSFCKGTKIQGFFLTDFTNQPIDIKEITRNKNTALLFWNLEYTSKSFVASKIKYFQKKYNNIQFVVVKIDGDNNDRIRRLDIKDQYFIDSNVPENSFLSSKLPRTILINKQGIIENGYAAISSPKIYTQLRKLNKK